jgi:hypothetical protein
VEVVVEEEVVIKVMMMVVAVGEEVVIKVMITVMLCE